MNRRNMLYGGVAAAAGLAGAGAAWWKCQPDAVVPPAGAGAAGKAEETYEAFGV